MSEVEVFQFPATGQPVRTVLVNGQPEWVVADVCAALDHTNPTVAVAGLDDDERGLRSVETPSGVQQMVTVNEAGLYSLILRSRKPQARAFKRWVTHEVLPAIRREGGYISPAATADQLTLLAARAEVQTRVLRNLTGIVDSAWLEAKARHVAARALGEEPEVDHDLRPLTVSDYLQERDITGVALRKLAPKFGKRLKRTYIRLTGEVPGTAPRFVDGAIRDVAAYTERHRPIFDATWRDITGEEA